MKKIIAVILSFVLMAGACMSVFSADAERAKAEEMLIKVKERIGNTDEYKEFTSTSSENGDNITYSFRWNDVIKSMNISVNSDGVIISYNKCNSEKKETENQGINKMSSDDALIKTRALFEKLNPDIADDIKIEKNSEYENLYEKGYSFSLQRTYGGIDVMGDSGYIRVSENANEIESFNLTYTQNLTFEKADAVIDRDKAIEIYKKELGMELYYSFKNDKAVLLYQPKSDDKYISATEGKAINPIEPQYRYMNKNESSADAMAPTFSVGGGSSLSEAEIKNMEEISGLISKEDAEKIIREEKLFSVDNSLKITYTGTSYNKATKKYFYSFQFEGEKKSASAKIDAQNGEIINYSYYDGNYEEKTPDNIIRAKEYAEKLAPRYYKADDSLSYRFAGVSNGSYTFSRYENDIICRGNSISLSVREDGVITYYNIRHTESEFESPEGILSEDEICDKLFENCGYKLYYYPACSKEDMTYADIAHLIYDVEDYDNTLVAKTGKKEYVATEIKVGNYTDIDNHYASGQIKTLAKFGIGFAEDEFKPDEKITQKDYVALVLSALVRYDAIVVGEKNQERVLSCFQSARQSDIVKENEANPDGGVSRRMATVFMIRALGLDEVASLDGIYVSKFKDVTENIGHISILNAMGVVNGYNGIFEPEKELTRADAIIMIYNYLDM